MYWEGRHLGRLPCGLEGRILVDQVSAEDEQSLQQIVGHVGPGEGHDVVLDGLLPATRGCQGDFGFTSDGLLDTISTTTKLYWQGRTLDKMGSILRADGTITADPMVMRLIGWHKTKARAPHSESSERQIPSQAQAMFESWPPSRLAIL